MNRLGRMAIHRARTQRLAAAGFEAWLPFVFVWVLFGVLFVCVFICLFVCLLLCLFVLCCISLICCFPLRFDSLGLDCYWVGALDLNFLGNQATARCCNCFPDLYLLVDLLVYFRCLSSS